MSPSERGFSQTLMQRCVRALARLEYGQIGRYFADHNELCETNDGDAFALFPSIKG